MKSARRLVRRAPTSSRAFLAASAARAAVSAFEMMALRAAGLVSSHSDTSCGLIQGEVVRWAWVNVQHPVSYARDGQQEEQEDIHVSVLQVLSHKR